jgi:hypothetical protein
MKAEALADAFDECGIAEPSDVDPDDFLIAARRLEGFDGTIFLLGAVIAIEAPVVDR